MINRRYHVRLLDCELVILHWSEHAQSVQLLANVDDVSLGGIRVRVDQAIPVGAKVRISYETLFDNVLTGVVKYQLERPEGIFLGIEFVEQTAEPMLALQPAFLE